METSIFLASGCFFEAIMLETSKSRIFINKQLTMSQYGLCNVKIWHGQY